MRFGPFFAGHPFPGFCLQRHADLLFRDSECNSYRSRPPSSRKISVDFPPQTALHCHPGRLEWHELVSDLETSRGLEIVHTSGGNSDDLMRIAFSHTGDGRILGFQLPGDGGKTRAK